MTSIRPRSLFPRARILARLHVLQAADAKVCAIAPCTIVWDDSVSGERLRILLLVEQPWVSQAVRFDPSWAKARSVAERSLTMYDVVNARAENVAQPVQSVVKF